MAVARISENRQSGFNLVEAAIVLGIAGLVLGGIWVAAATVQNNLKMRDTVSGVLEIAIRLRKIVSIRDSEGYGNNLTLTTLALNSNLVPAGWTARATSLYHPFNQPAILMNYTAPARFDFALQNLPEKTCNELAALLNRRIAADRDLNPNAALRIMNGSTTHTFTALPVALTGTECGSTNSIYMNFYFNRP